MQQRLAVANLSLSMAFVEVVENLFGVADVFDAVGDARRVLVSLPSFYRSNGWAEVLIEEGQTKTGKVLH